MTMMSAVATVPAAAFIPTASKASARPASRSAWDAAVRRLSAVRAEYEEMSAAHSAAFDAAEAECPDEREWFTRYNLRFYDNRARRRDRNVIAATEAIYAERLNALLRRASGRRYLTDEEVEQAKRDAEQIVDRFDAWGTARDEAHARHDCDEWEERLGAAADRWYKAQQEFLQTEAPDLTAISLKLETLAAIMIGEQDLASVELIHADAKRLLVNETAH